MASGSPSLPHVDSKVNATPFRKSYGDSETSEKDFDESTKTKASSNSSLESSTSGSGKSSSSGGSSAPLDFQYLRPPAKPSVPRKVRSENLSVRADVEPTSSSGDETTVPPSAGVHANHPSSAPAASTSGAGDGNTSSAPGPKLGGTYSATDITLDNSASVAGSSRATPLTEQSARNRRDHELTTEDDDHRDKSQPGKYLTPMPSLEQHKSCIGMFPDEVFFLLQCT